MEMKKYPAGIGPSSDVFAADGYLYVIANRADGFGGSLSIWSLADPLKPSFVSRVPNLGNLRQIAVKDGIALITAREDGLLIVDVSDPAYPKLLIRYDTVEFATAIAVGSHYAFIGCRQYGVEAIDIADPAHPRHVSYMHAGEVQSLTYENGLLATGTWGGMESNLFDVRDITHPKHLSRMELGGRGDGVFLRGNLLFAATGQFPRGGTGERDPDSPDYGMGNGMDIFNISDPTQPMLLSRTNLGFPLYYPGNDNWSVYSVGNYAYVGHNWSGAFVFDITDLTAPKMEGAAEFPIYPGEPAFFRMVTDEVKWFRPPRLPFDADKEARSPVTGIAVCDGVMYVATARTDLFILESEMFRTPVQTLDAGIAPENGDFFENNERNVLGGLPLLPVPGADVHNVICADGRLYAAGGHAGIIALTEDGEVLFRADTEAAVLDVGVYNGYLFAAETNRAMSVWKIGENDFTKVSEVDAEGWALRQLVVSENGRFAILHVEGECVWVVNISDPYHPVVGLREHHTIGLFYERQIMVTPMQGRYYGAHWNNSYIEWYDVSGEQIARRVHKQSRLSFGGGMTPYDENRVLVTLGSGYALMDFNYEGELGKLPLTARFAERMNGKPRIFGDRLYITDKMHAEMYVFDIADIAHPVHLFTYRFASYIGNVWEKDGEIYLAAGRQGIAKGKLL